MSDPLLTPEQIGERLGIEADTVRVWLRSGKLPGGVKVGARGLLRLRESLLEAYIDNLPPATAAHRQSAAEKRSAAARKANDTRGPEGRSEAARKANRNR